MSSLPIRQGYRVWGPRGVLSSLENICLQKQFCFFNRLLNMIVFDKSPQTQSSTVWLICSAPKWVIFGVITFSIQGLAARQHIFAALPLAAAAHDLLI
jgi:hypothetical protein